MEGNAWAASFLVRLQEEFGDSNSGLGLLTRCWLDLSKPTRYFSEGLDSDLCAPSCPLILVL